MDPLFSVIGTFDDHGGQMSRTQVEERLKKEGKCPECGQQLFHGRLLQKKPLTIPGKVLSGVCLNCSREGSHHSAGSGRSRNKSIKNTLVPLFGKSKAQSHRYLEASSENEMNQSMIKHSNSFDVDAVVADDSPIVPLKFSSEFPPTQKNTVAGDKTLLLSEETSSLANLGKKLSSMLLPNPSNKLTVSSDYEAEDLHSIFHQMDQCASSSDLSGIKELIQEHPSSNLLKAKGFRHFRNLIHATCTSQSNISYSSWIQILFHTIKNYSNHSQPSSDHDSACAVAEACGALWSFCVLSDDNKIAVSMEGIINAVMHAMEVVFRGNDIVTMWSVGLVSSMASCKHRSTMLSDGTFKAMLDLTFSSSRRSLQSDEVVFKSIWALSRINELKISLLASGAVSAVSSMMRRRLDDETIHTLGCLTFINLLVAIDDDKVSVKEVQEIVRAAVDSMEHHHKVIEILECGCYILTPFMANHATISHIRRAVGSVSSAVSNNYTSIIANNINNESLLHGFFFEAFDCSLNLLKQKHVDADKITEALHVLYLASRQNVLETLFTEQAIDNLLAVLKNNDSIVNIVLATFKILLLLSDISESSRLLIVSRGGVDDIIRSMHKNKYLEEVQEKGFYLLTSLCIDHQGNLAFLAADGIDSVLAAMEICAESAAVQEAAFAIISNFCSSAIITTSTEKIAANVLQAINDFDHSFLLLKEEGCRALWSLLSTTNNLSERLGAVKVVDTVLSTMKHNLDSPPLQEAACAALYAVVRENNCLSVILQNDVIEAVANSMKKHLVIEVQEPGIFVLAALSHHSTQIRLLLCEYLDLIIRAMWEYPNAMDLQWAAIKVLKLLTKDTSTAATIIVQLDGVRALTNTTSKNPENTKLRVAVIDSILLFTLHGQSSRHTKRDAIETVLGAMIANPSCKQTQIVALTALLSLCSRDKDAQSDASSLNAIKIVLQCMKNHLLAKDVCGHACGLMWTLALEPQRRKDILINGGVSTILRAMRPHLSSRSLQRKACGVLTALTSDGEGRLEARAAGGIDVVVNVMQAQSKQPEVLEEAFKVLSNLAVYSEDDPVLITSYNEIQVITSCMKYHLDVQSLQEVGCRTLWNYAQVPGNIPILSSSSELIHECLFQAALNFPACCTIVEPLLDMLLS